MQTDTDMAAVKVPSRVQWPFVPRAMLKEDSDLVFGGWLDSLKSQTPYSQMRNQTYRKGQTKVIEGLLKKEGVKVIVAAHPDGEPKFGFVCYEWRGDEFILHYLYVRSTYRQHNIATALLGYAGCRAGARPMTVTHWTRDIRHYRDKWDLSYNPWVAWEAL